MFLLVLGLWGFSLQARQARDITRKLDLEDLETALRRSLAVTGTLPPVHAPWWCGTLTAPEHRAIRTEVERFLRETAKYAKPEKPFPTDARFGGSPKEYLYVKTSPVSFELFAELEAERTNRFLLSDCGTDIAYDYAVRSLVRTPL
ncbi:MAG: hypothetical protein G01um101438_309 [Parcubacteria group bacterium Gr01-1014_38]|nr:MAG: hypothetical protein G01um101438_309 [Parcubacteria group bacterium Gr01-1014_38]